MHMDGIRAQLAEFNAAHPLPKPQKAQAPKANGNTTFTQDEQLRIQAERIVAALNLTEKGITAESLTKTVISVEKHPGALQ